MEKRKLSALPRPEATAEMVEMADRLDGMEHIVTAELVDDNKILLLNFYEVSKLKKGKTEAAFRTFLSSDDYITQDLSQSKVKWLTDSKKDNEKKRRTARFSALDNTIVRLTILFKTIQRELDSAFGLYDLKRQINRIANLDHKLTVREWKKAVSKTLGMWHI